MKKLKILLAVGIALASLQPAVAQKGNKFLEYNYEKKSTRERKTVPFAPIREADVLYAKRIERVIDTREKKNQVMNWPKSTLNDVVLDNLLKGEAGKPGLKLKAYGSDSLVNPLKLEDVHKLLRTCETISIAPDPDEPYFRIDTVVCTEIDRTQIVRWQVNEEWIFDKQQGIFFPRIISIAPMFRRTVGDITLPEAPLFYISYAEVRPILLGAEVFNRQNDAQRMTYYDFFESRMFSSYITKESNEHDLAINQMPEFKDDPIEALYESERVKNKLRDWEANLWED